MVDGIPRLERNRELPSDFPKKKRGEMWAISGWRAAENVPCKKEKERCGTKTILTLRLNYENYGKPD